MNFLGIDLGGTSVKYAVVDNKGVMSHEGGFPTASKDAHELLQKLEVVAQQYIQDFDIKGIGIACPGVIHPHEGRALWANFNMPEGWHKVHIKEFLENSLNIPVVVDNDVNAAAMGEKWLGAGQNYHTFICIAMGTGIGSGIVINDRLYYGSNFHAGEIGYIHANKGVTSFWEREASTIALVERIKEVLLATRTKSKEEIELIDGRWIFERYQQDSTLKMIVEDWADKLAKGIADAMCILDPQAIILGGGVSAEKTLLDLIIPRVKSYLPEAFYADVVVAQKGNDAAKLGIIKRLIDEHIV